MPRRRRAFIDRAKARTYEVVYRPLRDEAGSERVFRVVERGNAASASAATGADNLAYEPELLPELPYERQNFELGEYGFPDDGYDYAKHFKPIGGKGGVFISAPNPEIVKPTSSRAFQLRDDEAEAEESVVPVLSAVDELQRAQAIAEIKKERRQNPLLDEVFAALDSEGELQSDDEGQEDSADGAGEESKSEVADVVGLEDEDAFPDDFVVRANAYEGSSSGPLIVKEDVKEEIDTVRRPYRLLDDQFDKIMKGYEEDGHDEEENGEDHRAQWKEDDLSSTDVHSESELEVEMGLNDADLQALLGSDGFTLDTEENKAVEDLASMSISQAHDRDTVTSDSFKPEEHAETQLNSAMDQLMDSYKRVSADDAFAAIDGLKVARRAIAEAEKREQERLMKKDGAESDSSVDEELDAVLESMDDQREKWDCETIVSTYSNLENHPSVIDDADGTRRRPRNLPPVIRLDRRTQLPVSGDPVDVGESDLDLRRDFGSRRPPRIPIEPRNKNETKEEKRARKAASKEARRARRALKSEMKSAFAKEALVQNRHATALGKSKVAVQL